MYVVVKEPLKDYIKKNIVIKTYSLNKKFEYLNYPNPNLNNKLLTPINTYLYETYSLTKKHISKL